MCSLSLEEIGVVILAMKPFIVVKGYIFLRLKLKLLSFNHNLVYKNFIHVFLYLFLFLFLFACVEDNEHHKPFQIVIIFENAPANTVYAFPNGIKTTSGRSEEISYFDDLGIKQFVALTHVQFDSVIIKTTRQKLEVTHAYNGIEKLCFVFQNGDTALFNYNGRKPRASILNRDFSEILLNFDLYWLERFGDGDFSEDVKFNNPWLFSDFDFKSGSLSNKVDKVQQLAKERFVEILQNEGDLLDSLRFAGHISEEEMYYFKRRSSVDLKLMELQQDIGFRPLEKLPKELSISDFNLTVKGLFEIENQSTGLHSTEEDSDKYFQYHDKLLEWLLHNYYSRKVGRVTSTINNNGNPDAGSNLPNYLELYDTIKNSTLLSGFDKKVLLMKTMEQLIPTASLDQRKLYFEKFQEDTRDSAMINFLVSKYNFEQKQEEKMLLVSAVGDTVEFDQLISEYRGRFIYVDFWASWCAPCIKEWPSSEQLKERYKSENVVFIDISIDAEPERWLSSLVIHERSPGSNDYIVVNRYSSKQFDELNLEYIPRYMLFDKKGKIIETYAPRPSDDRLILLLNSHLGMKN